ncbi:MAG TPA: glycosyltransferase family 39 protein [Candidatus Limnocylindria bacterium]
METAQLILALGFWTAVPLTGYWVLTSAYRDIATFGWLETVGLSSAMGIAAWSPALLSLVALEAYSPDIVGVIGWLVIGGLLAWRVRSAGRPRRRLRSPASELDAWDLVLAGGLILVAVLYLGFPGEFVIGGRDENSYTLHAVWIAEHRRLDIPYPWPSDLHSMFYDAFLRWSGTFRTEPTMTPAFGHLFPVWIAQAMSAFGYEGLLRLNGVFSVISVLVVYGLCRSVISKPFAVAAALVLALNPAQIWISRTPLTEVLTQMLLWASIWLVVTALRRRTPVPARVGGYVLGVAVLVRIDVLLIAPLMVLAHLGTALLNDESPSSTPIWSAFYSTAIPSIVLASGYYLTFSMPYVAELMPQLAQIAALAAVAALLLTAGTRRWVRRRVGPIVTSRAFMVSVGLGLAGLTIYAWLIRPIHEPFRVFAESQVGLAGKRTFAEESLRDLAAYLSTPVVLAGIVGWFAALSKATRSRSGWWMPLLLIPAGLSVLYLWNPSVTPDHFWAVRRFVPIVIPGFVIFAGLGGWLALRRRPQVWSTAVCLVSLLLFGIFSYQAFRPFLFEAEHNGYRSQLAALAAELPDEGLVLALNGERWWKPLYLAFNRRVINLTLASAEGVAAMRSWISRELDESKEPIVIGVGDELPVPGLLYERVHTTTMDRRFHLGSRRPLPNRMEDDSVEISVFRILGADQSQAYRDTDLHVGLRWDVIRSGFHDPEVFQGARIAWTNGHGKVSLPIRGGPPAALSLSVRGSAIPDAELRVAVNGVELFRERIPLDGLRTTILLDGVPVESTMVIELTSESLSQIRTVPIDGSLYRRETEERSIGVAVESLKLLGVRSVSRQPVGHLSGDESRFVAD